MDVWWSEVSLKWNIQLEHSLEEGWPKKRRGLARVHVSVHWDAGPFPTGGALDGRDDEGTNLARLVGDKQVTYWQCILHFFCKVPVANWGSDPCESIVNLNMLQTETKTLEYGQCERQLGFPTGRENPRTSQRKWPNQVKEALKWHKNISKKEEEEWLKVADYSGHSWYIRGQVLTSCLT